MFVIFLDIDGVLIRHSSNAHDFEDAPCDALRYLVNWSGARIVISSSWRGFPHLYHELRRHNLLGSVIGDTPDLVRTTGNGVLAATTRGDEIAAWLKDHKPYVQGFVILDDEADMGKLKPWLVRTDGYVGFTMEHAERAKRVMQRDPFPQRLEVPA